MKNEVKAVKKVVKLAKKKAKIVPFALPSFSAKEFEIFLADIWACEEARNWARGKTFGKVWATCKRPDWMDWLIYNQVFGSGVKANIKDWGGKARERRVQNLFYSPKTYGGRKKYDSLSRKEIQQIRCDLYRKFYTVAPRRK